MLYAFLFLQTLTLCRTQWAHEKQVMRRTCHCPTFAPCESHQGGGMFFPFQITQWAVFMSVSWRYWQRVQQHLCQPFLHPCLAPSAACSSIRVFASSCMQGDSSCSLITSEQRSSFPRVVTTTPGEVSVVTLSLRRLNSCLVSILSQKLVPVSRHFPSSFYSNTHTRPPLHPCGRLENRVPILVKHYIDSLNRFHELTDWQWLLVQVCNFPVFLSLSCPTWR